MFILTSSTSSQFTKNKLVHRRRNTPNLLRKKQKKRDRSFRLGVLRLARHKQMKIILTTVTWEINTKPLRKKWLYTHSIMQKWLRAEIPRPTLSGQEDKHGESDADEFRLFHNFPNLAVVRKGGVSLPPSVSQVLRPTRSTNLNIGYEIW